MMPVTRQARVKRIARSLCGVLLLGVSGVAYAVDYQPQLDQPGKDVVWVPTPDSLVEKMLDLAKVGAADHVIDLGSGDGRLVITAARRGARALGIEYDAKLVEYARANAVKAGVAARAQFVKADLFASDFSRATVVTIFLGSELNRKLMPKLLNLKPGTRIVSNTHPIGDWPADEIAHSSDDEKSVYYRTARLWIVPAKIIGTWHSGRERYSFAQRYQNIEGVMTVNNASTQFSTVTLRGDRLSFSVNDVRYVGTVRGNVIEGAVSRGDHTQPWHAARMP